MSKFRLYKTWFGFRIIGATKTFKTKSEAERIKKQLERESSLTIFSTELNIEKVKIKKRKSKKLRM